MSYFTLYDNIEVEDVRRLKVSDFSLADLHEIADELNIQIGQLIEVMQ